MSTARSAEEMVTTPFCERENIADSDVVGIKVGDFQAKNFYRYFSLGDKLWHGTSGRVFTGNIKRRGGHTSRGKTVCAIKTVRKFLQKERKKQDLLREVAILRELDHPNVVKIFQFYPTDRGSYYVVLEFVVGRNLLDHMVQKSTYNEREARDIFGPLVGAVSYLHSRGIVHRDLKPDNILLAADGGDGASRLKIIDFERAMHVNNGPVKGSGGTPEFVSPEELLGKPHDTSPDMWSLGILVYILLSGRHPFFEADPTKMFIRAVAGDYQFKEGEWGDISGDAQDFISKLLVVNTDQRMTAEHAKGHPWLLASAESLECRVLRLETFKIFIATRKLRAAIKTALAGNRLLSWAPEEAFSKAYKLGAMLGKGGFGTVFKATPVLPANFSEEDWANAGSAAAPREYAVKRIEKKGLSKKDEQDVAAEAAIMRELDHPNVVSIHDFYQNDPNYFYMVLELMSGGELFDRIVQKQYYDESEARDVCLTLLETMKYIHGQGVVHRDLKPENLLLASPTDDSSIRVADFGLAFSVLDGYATEHCGTPCYIAPEILFNKPYGTSVDMWSIGVIMYVIISGYLPFTGENRNRMYLKIVKGQYEFHSECWNGVSSEAKDLVRKLLTVNPSRRLTAAQACEHPWLSTARRNLSQRDLGESLKNLKIFNARRKLRAAVRVGVLMARKVANHVGL